MNVGRKLTFIVSVDKGGLEKCTLSEILYYVNITNFHCSPFGGYPFAYITSKQR